MTEGVMKMRDILPEAAGTSLTPLVSCFRFIFEQSARNAWLDARRSCKGISVWRCMDPPHRTSPRYSYIVSIGENTARMAELVTICKRHGGQSVAPDAALVRALAIRRYGLAVAEASKPEGEQQLRHEQQDMKARLLPDGSTIPYEET